MALWNITNIVKFEYYVEAATPQDAIKEAFEADADETNESWHATEIDEDDEDTEDEDEDDTETESDEAEAA